MSVRAMRLIMVKIFQAYNGRACSILHESLPNGLAKSLRSIVLVGWAPVKNQAHDVTATKNIAQVKKMVPKSSVKLEMIVIREQPTGKPFQNYDTDAFSILSADISASFARPLSCTLFMARTSIVGAELLASKQVLDGSVGVFLPHRGIKKAFLQRHIHIIACDPIRDNAGNTTSVVTWANQVLFGNVEAGWTRAYPPLVHLDATSSTIGLLTSFPATSPAHAAT
ncbi:unnamed protein product [Zymoseptoria tritici ST99CH_1A5]|uniref:Uncharacterized protein n=1 Tax=Zymoseptoria tritici ST99CH_1A5 TaxID=1276529 RepID=A0A1Y6LUS5_ZYMTR|nr:unnamed protein product [Zymoseptoria tritici ST99CH_1A5]